MISKEQIKNKKWIEEWQHNNIICTREHTVYPYEAVLDLFGADALDYLYEASQGCGMGWLLNVNGKKCVSAFAFDVLRAFCGRVFYQEMVSQWKQNNEVVKNDSNAGTKRTTKRVSGKRTKAATV